LNCRRNHGRSIWLPIFLERSLKPLSFALSCWWQKKAAIAGRIF
jgi:hypothetical protein